jgi:hypothetical protein
VTKRAHSKTSLLQIVGKLLPLTCDAQQLVAVRASDAWPTTFLGAGFVADNSFFHGRAGTCATLMSHSRLFFGPCLKTDQAALYPFGVFKAGLGGVFSVAFAFFAH